MGGIQRTTLRSQQIAALPLLRLGERIALEDLLRKLPTMDRSLKFAPPGHGFVISAGVTAIARIYYPNLWRSPYYTKYEDRARVLTNLSLASSFGNWWGLFLTTPLPEHYRQSVHIELIEYHGETPPLWQ